MEFVGGTLGGAIAGVGLAIFFATTPVGWTAALIIGGATVLASKAGESLGKKYYNKNFKERDLVAEIGIDKFCD